MINFSYPWVQLGFGAFKHQFGNQKIQKNVCKKI